MNSYGYNRYRDFNYRFEVDMCEYYYIPKAHIFSYTGFITRNVRDCVCGLISSDQGYAFFHFFRKNDPQDLAEKIRRDFTNSTSIKVKLIGGNFLNAYLPWKEKNRELKYLSEDKMACLSTQEAIDQMNQASLIPYSDTTCKFEDLDLRKYEIGNHIDECTKKIGNNLLEYDENLLNEKLAAKGYVVTGFNGRCSFKICGIKDFTGYQNLRKVMQALTEETKLINKNDLECIHCEPGSILKVDFDGSCKADADPSEYHALNCFYFTSKSIAGFVPEEIKKTDQIFKKHFLQNRPSAESAEKPFVEVATSL